MKIVNLGRGGRGNNHEMTPAGKRCIILCVVRKKRKGTGIVRKRGLLVGRIVSAVGKRGVSRQKKRFLLGKKGLLAIPQKKGKERANSGIIMDWGRPWFTNTKWGKNS